MAKHLEFRSLNKPLSLYWISPTKNADGSFNYTSYDPLNCYGCYWGNDEYEAKPIEYGWSMLYDMETLIEFINHNNNDKDNDASLVIQRLDDMYLLHGHEKIVDVGNEPSFATPYLYNFINQQYRSVELVRYIMNTYFKTGESGLPGNSDAGSMQSWVIFAMMGIYPIPATTTYLITSPFVSSLTINLENGAQFKVKANNLSEKNIYVQSLKINGKNGIKIGLIIIRYLGKMEAPLNLNWVRILWFGKLVKDHLVLDITNYK